MNSAIPNRRRTITKQRIEGTHDTFQMMRDVSIEVH